MQEWRKRPNYAVLVDIRDRPDSQTTYVAEDNIVLLDPTEVNTINVLYDPLNS